MNDLSTGFIARLRARDSAAWFELWAIFGPILQRTLSRWGRGRIGAETVQDLSQETMAALAGAIDRHDPSREARFSTWLLAIARHTLGDELDRRMADKRGGGVRPASLDASFGGPDPALGPDRRYEQAVFDAKVGAALSALERESEFLDFEIFRQRVLEGRRGREVAASLGLSEATVSRRLASLRESLKGHLATIVARYSFTREELEEMERNGLDVNPRKRDESAFDEAVAEIYHRLSRARAESP